LRAGAAKTLKFPNKSTLLAVIFRFVARVNSYAHEMCHSRVIAAQPFDILKSCLFVQGGPGA
jgi:hypothetical protein